MSTIFDVLESIGLVAVGGVLLVALVFALIGFFMLFTAGPRDPEERL